MSIYENEREEATDAETKSRRAWAFPPARGELNGLDLSLLDPAVVAVKPWIGLHRSFDQIWHSYPGYVLVLDDGPRIALGPTTYTKHRFRIGDRVEGRGVPVPDQPRGWAELYKVRGLRVLQRGPESEDRPADPDGGVVPTLEEYRARGRARSVPGRKRGMVYVDQS